MPNALITGANKGIGLAVARGLGQLGMKVWLGSRSEERGQQAATELQKEGIDAEFVLLDVTNAETVKAAAEQIAKAGPALDVLVNNAGIMTENTGSFPQVRLPSEVPMADLHKIFETNFFGAVGVIQAMLPLLRQAEAARIVNISSGLGSLELNQVGAFPIRTLGYHSSKAALNMATIQFAHELRDTPIKINSISPGLVATDLNPHQAAEELASLPGFISPEEAAKIVIQFATLPEDGPSGGFFNSNGKIPW